MRIWTFQRYPYRYTHKLQMWTFGGVFCMAGAGWKTPEKTRQASGITPFALGRYDTVHCDEHPIGTNAVVAVITYTGQKRQPHLGVLVIKGGWRI